MYNVEHILRTARKQGADAFCIESGEPPRWRAGDCESGLEEAVLADELTAFLFRTMPASAQARLAMGQPVEFRANLDGEDWNLRAESTHRGLCVQVQAIRSLEETFHSLCVDEPVDRTLEQVFRPKMRPDDEDDTIACSSDANETNQTKAPAQEPAQDHKIPDAAPAKAPRSCAVSPPPSSRERLADVDGEDRYDRILLQGRPAGASERGSGADDEALALAATWEFDGDIDLASNDCEAGVPAFVEDVPYGVSGPIDCGSFADPSFQGAQFDEGGTLLFVHRQRVLNEVLKHLPEPAIRVQDQTTIEQTREKTYTLIQGSCVLVCVEDPSRWFSWVMRRLEQGCTAVVLCSAQTELGAIRVFCGLHPEVPSARWLAEHRRIFLPSTASVRSLFSGSVGQAASF